MTGFVYYTILCRMIKKYQSQGYEIVTGKHPDYPDDIDHLLHSYRPDLVAHRNGSYLICDVETVETIDMNETIKHWELISNSKYSLDVALPINCYEHARSVAQKHQIQVLNWWKVLI
ncbi:MAG: hypothetical protein GX119_06880 [Syntrophomonadaceae bacterium]|nr:hypothetical protein [Syntrophomonadaceae bacterium]